MNWFRRKKSTVNMVVKVPEKTPEPPRPEPKRVLVTLYNYLVTLNDGSEVTIENSYSPNARAWQNADTWMIFETPVTMRWYRNPWEFNGWQQVSSGTREIIRIKTDDIRMIKTLGVVKKEVECR